MNLHTWPQHRPSAISGVPELDPLYDAWAKSRERFSALKNALDRDPLPASIACVAVSGSLSRMEAHADSDLDLLVVLDDRDETPSEAESRAIYDHIWNRCAADDPAEPQPAALSRPLPGGVFSRCVSWRRLTNPQARGIIDEDMTDYGQRMQLLLDAQPLTRHHSFTELQCDLLRWYSEDSVGRRFGESGQFHWLRHDVLRYWHSIASRACWLYRDQPLKAQLVNLKLRSSRLVMIAGFLTAIVTTQKSHGFNASAVASLQQELMKTPLERLCETLPDHDGVSRAATAYQTLWQYIASRPVIATVLPPHIASALRQLQSLMWW